MLLTPLLVVTVTVLGATLISGWVMGTHQQFEAKKIQLVSRMTFHSIFHTKPIINSYSFAYRDIFDAFHLDEFNFDQRINSFFHFF